MGRAEEMYLLFIRENYYIGVRGGAYRTTIYHYKIKINPCRKNR